MDVILDLFARKQKQHTHAGNLFVVDSLDKQMQNEKEFIRLASAKGGWAILYLCGEH